MSGERSLPAVVQDIFGNLQDIVRAEVSLARAELREEASGEYTSCRRGQSNESRRMSNGPDSQTSRSRDPRMLEQLGSNLEQLARRTDNVTDWRENYRARPFVFMGAAFA